MARVLQQHTKIVQDLIPQLASSDAVNGAGTVMNGYNRALISFHGGIVTTGDSDDLITFTVSKNEATTTPAGTSASDWVVITAATQVIGPSADTTAGLGMEFVDLDFAKHSLSTGLLRITATGSLGVTASMAGIINLYRSGTKHSDTLMTIVNPASS